MEEARRRGKEDMRRVAEEEPNWFVGWEEQLPSPNELMPLSQTLISPDLALAFDIPTPNRCPQSPPAAARSLAAQHHQQQRHQQIQNGLGSQQSDFDSGDLGGGGAGAGDEPARTLKRPRLVWTPQLHKRFVEAVAHLGIKNAVPKTIMQLMSVDGLTRENVASHLQKYRLYLKRMQGPMGPAPGSSTAVTGPPSAEDQLFASTPFPHHFLTRPGAADPYMPFVPVSALQPPQQHHDHRHHHNPSRHQMDAPAAAAVQQQPLYYHQLHHFVSPQGNGVGFDHGFLARAAPQVAAHPLLDMLPPPVSHQASTASSYVDDPDSGTGGEGGRRVLMLFPTGDD